MNLFALIRVVRKTNVKVYTRHTSSLWLVIQSEAMNLIALIRVYRKTNVKVHTRHTPSLWLVIQSEAAAKGCATALRCS